MDIYFSVLKDQGGSHGILSLLGYKNYHLVWDFSENGITQLRSLFKEHGFLELYSSMYSLP